MSDAEHSSPTTHPAPSSRLYVAIWAALVLLTMLTVSVTYLDLRKLTLVAALLIASVKASLVLLYFMHLRYESRTFSIMLLVGLGAFAIFIGLTFGDLIYRFP